MFKLRSIKKELLDAEEIPTLDLFQNLKELHTINNKLGGYKITLNALNKILKEEKINTIVDIGSGGGDTLKTIDKWAQKNKVQLNLYGIDLKPICIKYSIENEPNGKLNFICDDYRNIKIHIDKVDIIHASLFCHHLSTLEIIDLIKFSITQKAILVVNDLERNRFAYFAIKYLTLLFSKSYLVKHDAPLSVLRGFKKKEWLEMLSNSGAKRYTVKNKWAFRHEVIIYG